MNEQERKRQQILERRRKRKEMIKQNRKNVRTGCGCGRRRKK